MIVHVDAASDRHRRIIDLLDAHGRVKVGDLAARLGVAPETIRRDLRQLEGHGLLQRVHGGAVRRAERPLSPFDWTTPEHPPLHVRLAEVVVEQLPVRGTVLLAASSLTWAVAESLSRRPPTEPGLTVVTTGLDVAVVLSRVRNLHVYNIGGRVEPLHRAQQGNWALDELRRFRVDIAVVSPAGLSIENGIFAATSTAAAITAAEIELAERVWLLMEGADIGHSGVVRVGDVAHVDHLYAAGALDSLQVSAVREAGITVIGVE